MHIQWTIYVMWKAMKRQFDIVRKYDLNLIDRIEI